VEDLGWHTCRNEVRENEARYSVAGSLITDIIEDCLLPTGDDQVALFLNNKWQVDFWSVGTTALEERFSVQDLECMSMASPQSRAVRDESNSLTRLVRINVQATDLQAMERARSQR
jgi:hypothetical protein